MSFEELLEAHGGITDEDTKVEATDDVFSMEAFRKATGKPTPTKAVKAKDIPKQSIEPKPNEFYNDPIVKGLIQKYTSEAEPQVESLLHVQGQIEAFKSSYKIADMNIDRGRLGYKVLEGTATKEDYDELNKLNKQIYLQHKRTKDDPYVAKATGQIAPFLIESAREGGKGALIGAMIGGGAAAIAGQAGPQAAFPEEALTVPAMAWAGSKIGSMFYGVENMRQIEAGGFYVDMLESGIDPKIAKVFAHTYSGISVGFEAAQLKLLKRMIPGGDKLAKYAVTEAIRKVAEDITGKAAGRAAANIATVATGEAIVETTQQATQNLLDIFAVELSDSLADTNISDKDKRSFIKKATEGLGETFLTTLTGMGVTSLPGTTVSLTIDTAGNVKSKLRGDPDETETTTDIEEEGSGVTEEESQEEPPITEIDTATTEDEIKEVPKHDGLAEADEIIKETEVPQVDVAPDQDLEGDLETPSVPPEASDVDLTGEEAAELIDKDIPIKKTKQPKLKDAMTSLPKVPDTKDEKKAQEAVDELGLDVKIPDELPPVPKPDAFALKREPRPEEPPRFGDGINVSQEELREPAIAWVDEEGNRKYRKFDKIPAWTFGLRKEKGYSFDNLRSFKHAIEAWRKGRQALEKEGIDPDSMIEGFWSDKHKFIDKRAKIKKRGDEFISLAEHTKDKIAERDAVVIRDLATRLKNNPDFGRLLHEQHGDDQGRAIAAALDKAEKSDQALGNTATQEQISEVVDLITEKKVLRNAMRNPYSGFLRNESDITAAQTAAAEKIWRWRLDPENKGQKLNPGLAVNIAKQAIANHVQSSDLIGSRKVFQQGRVPVLTGTDIDALHEVDDLTLQIEGRHNKLREKIQAYIAKVKDPALKKKANDLLLKEVGISKEDVKAVNKAVSKKQRVPDESASIFNQIDALHALRGEGEGTVVAAIGAHTQETGEPVTGKITTTSGRVGEITEKPRVVMQQIEVHGPYPRRITAEINAEDMAEDRKDNQFIVQRGKDGRDFVIVESAPILAGVAKGGVTPSKTPQKSKTELYKEAVERRLKAGKEQIQGKRAAPTKRPKRVVKTEVESKRVSVDKAISDTEKAYRSHAVPGDIAYSEAAREAQRKADIKRYGTPLQRAAKGQPLTRREGEKLHNDLESKRKKNEKGKQWVLKKVTDEEGSAGIINSFAATIIGLPTKIVNAYHKASEGLRWGYNFLDVESRFKGWADEVGTVVKTYYSKRSAHQLNAMRDAQRVIRANKSIFKRAGFSYDNQASFDVVMTAEDPEYLDMHRPDTDTAYKDAVYKSSVLLNDYFEAKEKRYKEAGIHFNFQERMRNDAVERLGQVAPGTPEAQAIIEEITELDRIEFVHIPIGVLQTSLNHLKRKTREGSKERKTIDGLFNLAVEKKRTTTLGRMFRRAASKESKEAGTLSNQQKLMIELLDPSSVIMNYGNRFGKDMAKIDIRDTMVEAGIMKKIERNAKIPATWIKYNDKSHGVLRGYAIDPRAHEGLLATFAVEQGRTKYDKLINLTKMTAFFNPLFLPFYDTIQSLMTGTHVRHPIRSIPNLARAFYHTFTMSDEYLEAMELGLFSKPFDFPFEKFRTSMDDILKGTSSKYYKGNDLVDGAARYALTLWRQTKSIKSGSAIGAAYKLSWDTAWKLDETIRMWTYLQMQNQKLWPMLKGKELKAGKIGKAAAAQTAARFHGDYASVPAKTRKWMNRFFFTPTFKFAMTKLYVDMLASLWRYPIAVIEGKNASVKDQQRMFAFGLMSTAAFTIGVDAVMRGMGFEPDDDEGYGFINYGRKYKRNINTRFDGPMEFIISIPTPANILQRYAQRYAKARMRIEHGYNPFMEMLKIAKYDLHPLYQNVWSSLEGYKPDGSKIYHQSESEGMKWLKAGAHTLTGAIQMGKPMEDAWMPDRLTPKGKQEARKQIAKLNKVMAYAIDNPAQLTIMSAHVRTPKMRRLVQDMRRLGREFNKDQKQHIMSTGRYNKEWLQNALNTYNEMIEEIKESRRKKRGK
jgi:hypothetical protein